MEAHSIYMREHRDLVKNLIRRLGRRSARTYTRKFYLFISTIHASQALYMKMTMRYSNFMKPGCGLRHYLCAYER